MALALNNAQRFTKETKQNLYLIIELKNFFSYESFVMSDIHVYCTLKNQQNTYTHYLSRGERIARLGFVYFGRLYIYIYIYIYIYTHTHTHKKKGFCMIHIGSQKVTL